MIGQYQYMKEPYEEENDINTGLDHNGLVSGVHILSHNFVEKYKMKTLLS